MRKILCVLVLLVMMAGTSHALDGDTVRIGLLSKINSTEAKFAETWHQAFVPKNGDLNVEVKFYDTLTMMLLDLKNENISHMILPFVPAQYVLSQHDDLESALILRSNSMGLAFGFREDRKELRDKFNEALQHMRDNWALPTLEAIYLAMPGTEEPDPIDFEHFRGAPTIRVAVTGDLPPIDYVAPDGSPAGFNKAVLAEIASYLHMNIEFLNITAGARSAALASGRADVVFWYEIDINSKEQPDIPEGVIVSEPYYQWNRFVHIQKIPGGKKSGSWNFKRDILDRHHTTR